MDVWKDIQNKDMDWGVEPTSFGIYEWADNDDLKHLLEDVYKVK